MKSDPQLIVGNLKKQLAKDDLWLAKLCSNHFALHLAIFREPYLSFIMEGKKKIETRFAKRACPPFERISTGDVVLLKKAGGEIVGICEIDRVWFYRLDEEAFAFIKNRFGKDICAIDESFWTERECKTVATLMSIKNVAPIEGIKVTKRDRRGWVIVRDQQDQSLLQWAESRIKEGPMDVARSKKLNDRVNSEAKGPSKETADLPTSLKSDCQGGLHCFIRSPHRNGSGFPCCRYCKADCVKWEMLHRRNKSSIPLAVVELRREFWRNSWFGRDIDVTAKNHALRKGTVLFREHARKRLCQSVGPGSPYRDGFQTPYSGKLIYYAQHAVATCCRTCIETWHGIPKSCELSEEHIDYLLELVMEYVKFALPNMGEEGIQIARPAKP